VQFKFVVIGIEYPGGVYRTTINRSVLHNPAMLNRIVGIFFIRNH